MSSVKQLDTLLAQVNALSKDNSDPKLSDNGLIGHCLRTSITYRLPEAAKFDRLIGFRMMMRCLKRMNSQNRSPIAKGKGKQLVIQGNAKNAEKILNYITLQSGEKTDHFFSKEHAPLEGYALSGAEKRRVLANYLSTAVKCLFKKDRQHRSIWPWAALEAHCLLNYTRENKIECVYDFSPYLIDANWYTKLLMQEGIEVYRVPSSGPLKAHNKFMIGDHATLSTPYQFMEAEKYKQTIRPNHFHKWIPERAFEYIDTYQNPNLPEPPARSIGFYSHASWLRAKEGHSDNGLNIHQGELTLLGHLGELLKSEKEVRLVIFLHPRERLDSVIEETEAYYQAQFPNTPFAFSDSNEQSAEGFHKVDLGIAVYSTILYERLFSGYKSLIGNYGMNDFPDPDSSLANICFQSKETLFEQLQQAFDQNRSTFFEEKKITGYRFDDYPAMKG